MRIIDWSSDVCSSDLQGEVLLHVQVDRSAVSRHLAHHVAQQAAEVSRRRCLPPLAAGEGEVAFHHVLHLGDVGLQVLRVGHVAQHLELQLHASERRSEEHTSELQSLMRISYAVFCLKKKNQQTTDP